MGNGQGRQKETFSRVFGTYAKKLDVLNHLALTNDMSKTLDAFYGDLVPSKRKTKRKVIYLWKKQRSLIEEMCMTSTRAQQRSARETGTATVISRQGKEAIKVWINSVRSEGVPISALMLHLKAHQVADDDGIPADLFSGS